MIKYEMKRQTKPGNIVIMILYITVIFTLYVFSKKQGVIMTNNYESVRTSATCLLCSFLCWKLFNASGDVLPPIVNYTTRFYIFSSRVIVMTLLSIITVILPIIIMSAFNQITGFYHLVGVVIGCLLIIMISLFLRMLTINLAHYVWASVALILVAIFIEQVEVIRFIDYIQAINYFDGFTIKNLLLLVVSFILLQLSYHIYLRKDLMTNNGKGNSVLSK